MACGCGDIRCNGMCDYMVGSRLADFIRNIDLVESKIGEIEKGSTRGENLIVIGMRYFRPNDIGKILVNSRGAKINLGKIFNKYNDKTAKQVMGTYVKNSMCEDGEQLMDIVSKLERSKLLLNPIKAGTHIVTKMTRLNEEKRKEEKVDSKCDIMAIKWYIDKESGDLKSELKTGIYNTTTCYKTVLDIQDYCKSFTLENIGRGHGAGQLKGIIEMTNFGYIRPVEIKEKEKSVIVDNRSIYYRDGDEVYEVGYYVNNNGTIAVKMSKQIPNKRLNESLSNNFEFIAKHCKFIAPYGLSDTKVVELKK